MRIRVARSANKIDRKSEERSGLVAESRHGEPKDDARGAGERLAIVMRHNAAALLLNRALFEYQADRVTK